MKYSHFAAVVILIAIALIVALWLTKPTQLMPQSQQEIKATPLPYTSPLEVNEGKG